MALSATLHRVKLDISDVDRGVYEQLDFRIAQHPSEDDTRLVARILAFALLQEEGLAFGRGLSNADEPALWTHDLTGTLVHWVDVGTPSAERIHSASKKAPRVTIVCHKSREALIRELSKQPIHRADEVRVVLLDPAFTRTLGEQYLTRPDWTVVRFDGSLTVTSGDESLTSNQEELALSDLLAAESA